MSEEDLLDWGDDSTSGEDVSLEDILDSGEETLDLSKVIMEGEPLTRSFDGPLDAKRELMRWGRDITILHRKVAMGEVPGFRGNVNLLNAQFQQVMSLKTSDWEALLPPNIMNQLKKTGKVTQAQITELFVECLSGNYTFEQVETLLHQNTELYRICNVENLLAEFEEAKRRFKQGMR